jgi:hypothetical protein
MESHVVRPKLALYRIALFGSAWHVVRPHGSLAHAFTDLDQAFAFVRTDCDGAEASVELMVDNFYMLKQIAKAP